MTDNLHRKLRIEDADGFYDQLMELHRELDPEQSQVANAKLVLLLANHIGDRAVLDAAIDIVTQQAAVR